MAWIQSKLRDKIFNPRHMEFDCDTTEDIQKLPGLEKCAMGSKAFVIATSREYRLNSLGEWKPVSTGGSGGGGGDAGGADVSVDGETLVTQDGIAGFSVEDETLICL